jgi:NAD(P)-dependent dehydrogenase (short-subunit alcohol dehydrogenase family)
LIESTVAAFGRLDVLVNNAGIGEFGPVADMRPEVWDDIIQTNLSGAFYCTHEAIPELRKAGNSWIINIGSLAGKNPFAGGAAYNASKFGLLGFSEALMLDVRYDGIRVSCVMPGSVATEFSGRDATAEDWRIAPEDVARVVMDLLAFPERSLPSRVEIRPTKPPRRG